ncbi:unnamed protein product, partial [Rotaria sp. Silwood2]
NETSKNNNGHQEVPSTPNPGAAASEDFDKNTEVKKSFKTPAQHQRTNESRKKAKTIGKEYT